jgi:hypothetical protein
MVNQWIIADNSNVWNANLPSFPESKSVGNCVTIFYNVYFGRDHNLTLSIVREQLEFISQTHHLLNATILFVPIGNFTYYPSCKGQNCKKNQKVETGDEVITLQHLYNHCLERQNEQVIYLHSKGSFHPRFENDLLRRLLTRSVVSQQCNLEQNTKNLTSEFSLCNVCSARFSPYPHWHAPETCGEHAVVTFLN